MASDERAGQNGAIDWDGLAAAVPPRFFQGARWFRHKADPVRQSRFFDGVDLTPFAPAGRDRLLLALLRVELASGAEALYQAPFRLMESGAGGEETDDAFPVGWQGAAAVDAVGSDAFQTAFRRLMDEGATLPGRHGRFRFERLPDRAPRQCRSLAATSTNSLVLVRGDDVVKHLRCLAPGMSPELEIGRFFAARGASPHVPPLTGACSYLGDDGQEFTLAVSHRFIENEGDLWEWTQAFLQGYLPACADSPAPADGAAPPSSLGYLEQTAALAEVLAAVHRALGQDGGDPAFRPEPVTREDLGQWADRMRRSAGAVFDRVAALPAPAAGPVGEFLARLPAVRAEVLAAFAALPGLDPDGWVRGRVHGDFHLGQALKTRNGFVIMDFEGEPLADPAQRRQRHSPYKDVAGLLRSYNYAAFAALFAWRDAGPPVAEARWEKARNDALAWNRAVEKVFRQRYDQAAGMAPTPDLDRLVSALKLEKAVYELDYEINNRPSWVEIPLSGIEACLADFRP